MRSTKFLALTLLCTVVACDKTKEPESASKTTVPIATAAPVTLSAKLSRPMPERLVAIGDLHGDGAHARRALRLAGAIDDKDMWIGGKLVVVQTGDQIDRGDDDRAILDLVEELKRQAAAVGGELISLDGNHEVMNAEHDFRYVTEGGFKAFADRKKAFEPGGQYAEIIAHHPMFVKVGDNVLVHGGILPKHVRYGLDRMNDELDEWLSGKRKSAPAIVTSEDGPVWTRAYSSDADPPDCASLKFALEQLGAKRMIVGHTVQKRGANSACDGAVWRIDVGMASYFGGPIEVLEIRGEKATVLKEQGSPFK